MYRRYNVDIFKQTYCIPSMRAYALSGLMRKKEVKVIIFCAIIHMQLTVEIPVCMSPLQRVYLSMKDVLNKGHLSNESTVWSINHIVLSLKFYASVLHWSRLVSW